MQTSVASLVVELREYADEIEEEDEDDADARKGIHSWSVVLSDFVCEILAVIGSYPTGNTRRQRTT